MSHPTIEFASDEYLRLVCSIFTSEPWQGIQSEKTGCADLR